MNPSSDLTVISRKFIRRIDRLHREAASNNSRVDRYCLVAISQLNNFLRSYLFSIRIGAHDSNGARPTFSRIFPSEDLLIDEIIKLGNARRWRAGQVGNWVQKDEPAFHCPHIFLKIVNGLGCSNLPVITGALTDSWKVDILREVRNYFAHRCIDTEKVAVRSVSARYAVNERAAKILMERDATLAQDVIDDIHDYLRDFAKALS